MSMHGVDNRVSISFHETYYCLHGAETGTTIRADAKALHDLADYIKENIPEPETLTDANLLNAMSKLSGLTYFFAKIEGTWYSQDGAEISEEHLLEDYNITEVLR